MNLPGARKRHLMAQLVQLLQHRFEIKPLRSYAEGLADEPNLARRRAKFSSSPAAAAVKADGYMRCAMLRLKTGVGHRI